MCIISRCPREGCDELFAAISDLTSHLSSTHSNGAGAQGSYKCDTCGAPFDNLATLKIHQVHFAFNVKLETALLYLHLILHFVL